MYAPDYFGEFKCIAKDCKHSCCIGWEIDIDKASFDRFQTAGGKFGDKMKENIVTGDGSAYFRLGEGDRCPFLRADNLCEMILTMGEDYLCDICRDHPRFRNFFESREEIGLGLCCEAAGEIILGRKDKTRIIKISDDDETIPPDEQAYFSMRDELFDIVTNREKKIDERIDELLNTFELSFPDMSINAWADVFLSLERLDSAWTDILLRLKEFSPSKLSGEWDTAFEQLICYFLYRHTPDCLYDERVEERILFSILGYKMIYHIFLMLSQERGEEVFSDLVEAARMYSSEIEYSEENINTLLEILGE